MRYLRWPPVWRAMVFVPLFALWLPFLVLCALICPLSLFTIKGFLIWSDVADWLVDQTGFDL